MIARISGKIKEKGAQYLLIEIGGICYEVLLPANVMQRIDEVMQPDGSVDLITYHYYQVEPSRSTPVLIGFTNDIEKDFFETFITVSGIGPKAALKALNKPIPAIARAIDEADLQFLRSLPGIGQQRAKEIVAKLQNKVGKFGLMKDQSAGEPSVQTQDIQAEALAVLLQLEYKRSEAAEMIKKALERSPGIESTPELLNEVYKQRKAES